MRLMFRVLCVSLLSILLMAPALRGDDKKDPLEAVKALAGTWVPEKPMDGHPGGEINFKVTSAGTVVQETMFPGSEHEMVNMYHMDGDNFLVTHYCAMGVQ